MADPAGVPKATPRKPWRAWNTFQACLALVFLAFLAFLAAALVLKVRHGELTTAEAKALLALLYRGTYPFVFVGLGALAWHWVKSYSGAYARR